MTTTEPAQRSVPDPEEVPPTVGAESECSCRFGGGSLSAASAEPGSSSSSSTRSVITGLRGSPGISVKMKIEYLK